MVLFGMRFVFTAACIVYCLVRVLGGTLLFTQLGCRLLLLGLIALVFVYCDFAVCLMLLGCLLVLVWFAGFTLFVLSILIAGVLMTLLDWFAVYCLCGLYVLNCFVLLLVVLLLC